MTEGPRQSIASITPSAIGSDSRSYKIAASFTRAGYQSVVVEGSPSSLGNTPPFGLLPVGARNVSSGSTSRLSKAIQVLRRDLVDVAQVTPKADLYYLHSYQPYPGVAWRRLRHPGPLVYDAHDFYDEFMPPGLGAAAKRFWQRRAVRAAAAFVTVSEGVADLFEQHYGRRPTVIRNAHDARLDTKVASGLRERLALGPEVRLFVVVGDSKPQRAIEQVIHALTALPQDVHIAFVGRGYEDRLAGHVPASLATRVHVVGPVEPTEVVPFVASADAAFAPYVVAQINTRYALPNGFFQSVAAGLPLVVPEDLPELRALAGSAGIAVDFVDTDSVARGARQLLDDDAGTAVARTAVNKLSEELTWEAEEARLLELVATALEPTHHR